MADFVGWIVEVADTPEIIDDSNFFISSSSSS